jgi:sugar transferase (PEP-CTERM system associated)
LGLSYIRVNKHYVHLPYLYLAIAEAFSLVISLRLAFAVVEYHNPTAEFSDFLAPVSYLIFVAVLTFSSLAMGVYSSLVREGLVNMLLRTLVSFFLLSSAALFLIDLITLEAFFGQRLIFWAILIATSIISIIRLIFTRMVDAKQVRRRVVFYGAGAKAKKLLEQLMPNSGSLAIDIFACVPSAEESVEVTEVTVIPEPEDWVKLVRENQISEIVITPDERRRLSGDAFPLSQFLDCKLMGVPSVYAQSFYEREMGIIDVSLLQPGWMLYSDGFNFSRSSLLAKRLFDILLASLFLLLLWPFMLLTAIAVKLESKGPALYHQVRVGLHGKTFRIYKFRSMRQDAEKNGAVWAQKNDNRVTRVGAFIRNTRLDELPQIYNVLVGQMSFVGPRPERPEFVKSLSEQIPYYDMRHKVKPGLMGWAQLKYPYGASVEDAKNKLQYDLYYTKNHSFMMDVLIMIQTVEIILLGKGVH